MARLLLVRHGETNWNVQARYQGQTDVPLNDAGRRQAEALAQRLSAQEISAIYASDLQRARQTALAIAERHHLPVRDEPRFREMCFGDWEGLTHGQIQERYPRELAAWHADVSRVTPPRGESLAEVASRVQAAFQDLVREAAGETVLLVSHGGTLRVLLCLAMQMDVGMYWRFGMKVASISELGIYDRGSILMRLNDTCHHTGQ